MEFNYDKLRGRIREKCGTQTDFACKIGISYTSLSERLNNKIQFNQSDIVRSCDVLEIDPNEVNAYFFTPKIKKT